MPHSFAPMSGSPYTVEFGETNINPNRFRCHVAILKDDEDQFSAVVLNLPGAGSCGETEAEAMNQVREAVAGVIESYLDAGKEIPWSAPGDYEIPEGAKLKWILVRVG